MKDNFKTEDGSLFLLNRMEDVEETLQGCYMKLIEINKERQFDYCTSSTLSNKTDNINEIMKKINKIVYQK